jgi:REP element-mobilizing transposase RayT
VQGLPTRKRIRLSNSVYQQGHAFSITITCDGRYPWFRLYRRLAAMVVELLLNFAKRRETVLYAWCTMPDHIHMLLQDKDVVELVRLLKGRLTPEARRLEPGRVLWQRGFTTMRSAKLNHCSMLHATFGRIQSVWGSLIVLPVIHGPVPRSGRIGRRCWLLMSGRG